MTSDANQAAELWMTRFRLRPLGNGHIHDTYLVEEEDRTYRLVLQKINQRIFSDPKKLISQTLRVMAHLKSKNVLLVPDLVHSKSGRSLEKLDGSHWRAWTYVNDSRTLDPITSLIQAENAAEAFGLFQNCMSDLARPTLEEPIRGFLQLSSYLIAYQAVRARSPKELDDLIESNLWLAERFLSRDAVIHGDCKIDNLLFHEREDSVKAVLDLDTVMQGHWAWDFGDLVRSLWSGEKNIDEALFVSALKGFLRGAPDRNYSVEDFAHAPIYIMFMLGVRFLTDHLQGDQYFKVQHTGENLVRAREQFSLFEECLSRSESLLRLAENNILDR